MHGKTLKLILELEELVQIGASEALLDGAGERDDIVVDWGVPGVAHPGVGCRAAQPSSGSGSCAWWDTGEVALGGQAGHGKLRNTAGQCTWRTWRLQI